MFHSRTIQNSDTKSTSDITGYPKIRSKIYLAHRARTVRAKRTSEIRFRQNVKWVKSPNKRWVAYSASLSCWLRLAMVMKLWLGPLSRPPRPRSPLSPVSYKTVVISSDDLNVRVQCWSWLWTPQDIRLFQITRPSCKLGYW